MYTEGGVIVEEGASEQLFHAPCDEHIRRFLDRTQTCVRRKRSNLKLAHLTS